MNILIFQVAIFFIIVFASYLGKRPLITTFILVTVFTIVMVKTSPLMILQFFTIIYSFSFCFRRIERSEKEITKSYSSKYSQKLIKKREKSKFEIIIRIIVSLIIVVAVIFGLYKWIFFIFDINDGFMIFLAILNTLLFGTIAYIIIEFTYYGISESISNLFHKKT